MSKFHSSSSGGRTKKAVGKTAPAVVVPSRAAIDKKQSKRRLYAPKSKYFDFAYLEPERRIRIERAIAERTRVAAKPFKASANQNRHNWSGTFSDFEYLHTARPTTATAPAPHTNSLRDSIRFHDTVVTARNSLRPATSGDSKHAATANGSAAVPPLNLSLTKTVRSAVESNQSIAVRLSLPDQNGCPRVHQGLTSVRRQSNDLISARSLSASGRRLGEWMPAPYTDRPLRHVYRPATAPGVAPFHAAKNESLFDTAGSALAPNHTRSPLSRSMTLARTKWVSERVPHPAAEPFRGAHPASTTAPTDSVIGGGTTGRTALLAAAPPKDAKYDYRSANRVWTARTVDGYAAGNGFRPVHNPTANAIREVQSARAASATGAATARF